MHKIIKPKRLHKNSLIGVVAPASPAEEEKVQLAVWQIKRLGYRVKLGSAVHHQRGYLAGCDEKRAQDIHDMFMDQEVKGIFCIRGGYGTPRILELLDYEMIKRNPKAIVGYSDITALLNAITQKTGLITFHGPMAVSDMQEGLEPFSYEYLSKAINSGRQRYVVDNPAGADISALAGGVCKGRLAGGNLSMLCSLMGTRYEINTENKILFLEDAGEEPYRIDRMLTQLKLSGKLEQAAGFVLGSFHKCDASSPDKSLTLQQVFEDILVPLGKPVLQGYKAGHCTPNITLPIGASCVLDADHGILSVEECCTVDIKQ